LRRTFGRNPVRVSCYPGDCQGLIELTIIRHALVIRTCKREVSLGNFDSLLKHSP